MTPLGKALEFYLKYPCEMDRLYGWPMYHDSEEPDLTGLEDEERVKQMAKAVGTAAYDQVAEFLNACGDRIEGHFRQLGIAQLANKSKRSAILRDWTWRARCEVASVQGRYFRCGVSLLDQRRSVVSGYRRRPMPRSSPVSPGDQGGWVTVPWLWRKGGRAWEAQVLQRLQRLGCHELSGPDGGLVCHGGSVALASIPIFDGNRPDADLDRDALVEKVVRAFSALQAEDVKAISLTVGQEDVSAQPEQPGGETE